MKSSSSPPPTSNSVMKYLHDILHYPITTWVIWTWFLIDFVLSIVIVLKVPYTEIDWKAYMEEVEGYLGGERDYLQIRGNTGPLVYPAGFLYIFALLRQVTEEGTNIFLAQSIFCGIYLVNLLVVMNLYKRNGKIPFWVCGLLLLSKRVHSIYMLRMFNDCIAVLFGYIAIYFFTEEKWRIGSVFYSLGVSVKMNMFLHAPGIFIVWMLSLGVKGTVECIVICALVQLALGYPFLSTYPLSYISKAFEFSRVFFYKWTVNFKFLSEDIFLSKELSIGLLALTIVAYLIFMRFRLGKSLLDEKDSNVQRQSIWNQGVKKLSPAFIINTIFASNIIGVIFARTLHYQFYCWYFHMIPLILWNSRIPFLLSFLAIVGIEVAFNVFPAQAWSSILLQVCHGILLLAIFLSSPAYSNEEEKASVDKKK